MYSISIDLFPVFMKVMVNESHIPDNIRSTVKVEWGSNGDLKCTKKPNFMLPEIKTVSYRLEPNRYLGPKIWKLLPDELKEMSSLEVFKKNVKCL